MREMAQQAINPNRFNNFILRRFRLRTDRLVQRIRPHYDVIRYSLSAIRTDDTDILLATRK